MSSAGALDIFELPARSGCNKRTSQFSMRSGEPRSICRARGFQSYWSFELEILLVDALVIEPT